MRILKLFIAVVFSIGLFTTRARAQAGTDSGLIPAQSNSASSISEIATGNLQSSAASPLFAALPDSSASGAPTLNAPTPFALHLTPAIPNGATFTQTVTLPAPVTVPEPGAILLACGGSVILLRRPRQ